jgi:ABC-type transport system involved in multi-copper enzyme maturation permease subunit
LRREVAHASARGCIDVRIRLFTTAHAPLPSFVAFLGFLIPIVAIALGFDSISSEFNRRTMSHILAQPVYRDALLFGKFLACLAIWLLFAFFWQMIVPLVALRIAPVNPFDPYSQLHAINVDMDISRLSPNRLFAETTMAILDPSTRALGPVLSSEVEGAISGAPLPLSQSLLLIWPQLTSLLAAMVLLFTVAYVSFQRQEVRA